MISRSSLNVGSKTRSLGQICSEPCSPSRGNSFASIFIDIYRSCSLGDISVKFEHESCWVKTRSLDQVSLKTLFTL